MIFDQLVLHDFGVYRGRQAIDLSPPSPRKPIVLFGGLNGGGKTTLLRALQLVLFGRASGIWKSEGSSYDGFLRKLIHRAARPEEGAGLELGFRHVSEGEEKAYRIARYWQVKGNTVKEMVDVFAGNRHPDPVLSEHWAEYVEDFLPPRIAPLFFFDGEQIEQLADPSKSHEILSTATHSLLGLDLVDQLCDDLRAVERRTRNANGSPSEQDGRLEQLETALEGARSRLAQVQQQRAHHHNAVEQLEKRLRELATQLAKHGGELFEARQELEETQNKLKKEIAQVEEKLREAAARSLPLVLVGDLLRSVQADGSREAGATLARDALSFLENRDRELLELMAELGVGLDVADKVGRHLSHDRTHRQKEVETVRPYLQLPARVFRSLAGLIDETLPRELDAARALVGELGGLQLRLESIERRLAGMPDEETILPLLARRKELTSSLDKERAKVEALDETCRKARDEVEQADNTVSAEEKRLADASLATDDAGRLLLHSRRARDTLGRFRLAVLGKHVQRISTLVLDSFQMLLRKQHLVKDLHIDPATFKISLHSHGQGLIEPDSLSAGERQLLAVSLLWGLGRAAGRPLPAVIDTPLGRLDSEHRRNLVNHYFPHASHQVLLLSTDEEIDEEYHERISKWVGRSYYLDFDDEAQESHIEEGYFW